MILLTYQADCLKVWELISDITRGLDCWSYVKPDQHTRNGLLAFHNLYKHYLGNNNFDHMANSAEKRLQIMAYNGEKKRYMFENYIQIHVDQHAILNGLAEHDYSCIDNRRKVRHLMEGIKTRELDLAKTQILSSVPLRRNFDTCVTPYQEYIYQLRSTMPQHELSIAAVSQDADEGSVMEDRYYK